jgi:hypothetical protein
MGVAVAVEHPQNADPTGVIAERSATGSATDVTASSEATAWSARRAAAVLALVFTATASSPRTTIGRRPYAGHSYA